MSCCDCDHPITSRVLADGCAVWLCASCAQARADEGEDIEDYDAARERYEDERADRQRDEDWLGL